MPVLLTQAHPLSLGIYHLATGGTNLAMMLLPAGQTVGLTCFSYVFVTSQWSVTNPAAEVLQMPGTTLGPSVLVGENQFVTRITPWYVHQLGEVPATEELALAVKIEKILQPISTRRAAEAVWVPTSVPPCSLSKHGH